MKARIFDIKRFAVHDGNGIRTTVFFKGCPLRCVWCHNPEGLSTEPQLGLYGHKCIACGECVSVCPSGAHGIVDNIHTLERSRCNVCGACSTVCLGEALILYGRELTVEELLARLLEDKDFYDNSGGGVTLSGGECLLQADVCAELLKHLKENGVHTAVDTCGLVPRESFDKVIPYTDIFLYDVKAYDEETHIRCTGRSNGQILENLRYLDGLGKPTEIRIPYVPEYNSDQTEKIAKYLSAFKHITRIRVLPYHSNAGSKYAALNIKNSLPNKLPAEEEIARAIKILRDITALEAST